MCRKPTPPTLRRATGFLLRPGRSWAGPRPARPRLAAGRARLGAALIVIGNGLAAAGPAQYSDGRVTIPLATGMNLICLPVEPADTTAATIFAPLGPALRQVSAYDADSNTWSTYSPQAPSFLNTLNVLTPGQALTVLMEAPASLEIAGEPLDSVEFALQPGWNFVGDNGLSPRPPEQVFEDVAAGVTAVSTFDGGEWLTYLPQGPPDPNAMTEVVPGLGYWVYGQLPAPVTWFFDSVVYLLRHLRADLVVEGFEVVPSQSAGDPLEGEPLTFCAWVGNAGYQPAYNVVTKFYERHPGSGGYQYLGQDSTLLIDGGNHSLDCINVPGGFLFETVVKAVVDEGWPIGAIPELNERNNRRTEQIHIRMPDPAVTYSGSTLAPDAPYDDSTVTITTDLANLGDADADGFTLQFRLEDDAYTTLWSQDVNFGAGGEAAIPAGQSRTYNATVDVSSYVTAPGYFHFIAEVDPAGSLKESDDHNNKIYQSRYLPDPPIVTLEDPEYCCWISPKGPRVGDDVRVSVTVGNEGGATATKIVMTYDDTSDANGGQWLQGTRTTIPDVPVGSTDHTYNELQNVAEGTHTIKVDVDYTDENPQRTETFTLPDLSVRGLWPDVRPGRILIDQSYPDVNSNPQFSFDVSNSDQEGDAAAFDVSLYYTQADPWTDQNLTWIGTYNVSSGLTAGQTTNATIGWNAPPAGEFIVVVWADPTNGLTEVWDNNNQSALRDVLIRGSGPDLWARNVWSNPRNPMVNQQTRLKCSVVNAGNSAATFSTTFYEQQGQTRTEIDTVDGVTLAAEQSTTVSVSWKPTEDRPYQIVAVVDPNQQVTEAQPPARTNNEGTKTVYVRPRPYSIEMIEESVFADNDEAQRAWGGSGNHGKGWCYADSFDGCYWDRRWGIPYYNCDFQDRSSIRITAYKTFRVKGPSGDATLADVSLDLQVLGILDSLYAPWTGSAYWSAEAVAGIFRGRVDSIASANLNSPMRKTDPPLFSGDTGSLWEQLIGQGAATLAGELCSQVGCPWVGLVTTTLDAFTADAVAFEQGVYTFEDVTVRTGREYTAFVYVDLVTAAVGATSFSYADFFYHAPHNDLQAKAILKDRGVWLNNVTVDFK